jgi:hypothetical protein
MKKLIILILAVFFYNPVIAEDDNYDIAHKLATCSGTFEISAQIFSLIGGGEAQTTAVKEKANGWLIASIVFFMGDGMTSEGSWSSAQGVKDTTMSYWMARLESSHDPYASDEKNMESFFILVEELGDINTNECIIYDEMVEEAIKVYRRMANSS